MEETKQPQRLCSEIQLFDLCTKETCLHKTGRYCTNEEVLARFEAISDDDRSSDQYVDELDESEDDEEYAYDDDCGMEENENDEEDPEDW